MTKVNTINILMNYLIWLDYKATNWKEESEKITDADIRKIYLGLSEFCKTDFKVIVNALDEFKPKKKSKKLF